uniref:Knottin scorpion toxin-like domain-containing protein n=1 Tax=Oryza brachyantha TaxID=4533 RepID=J3MRL9_ORYBR
MAGRKLVVCLFLMLLLTLGSSWNPNPIDTCTESVSTLPLCVGFTCKYHCWLFAKFSKGKVLSRKCLGKGYKTKCYCMVCRK